MSHFRIRAKRNGSCWGGSRLQFHPVISLYTQERPAPHDTQPPHVYVGVLQRKHCVIIGGKLRVT